MIEVTTTLSVEDIRNTHWQIMFRRKALSIVIGSLMVILFGTAIFLALTNRRTGFFSFQNFLLLWPVALVVIMYFFIQYNLGKSYRTNKEFQSELHYSISTESITLKTIKSESMKTWQEVFKFLVVKDYVVVYMSSILYWVIPKRDIKAEDLDRLIEMGTTDTKKA